jgi:hypothetical protein
LVVVSQTIAGLVVQGARIASGLAEINPFGGGTIGLQAPHFKMQGFDISEFHPATVNVSIAPVSFSMTNPAVTIRNVLWAKGFPPEHFSFAHVQLLVGTSSYDSYIYYPHPETKLGFEKSNCVMEIIAPYIDGLQYGDAVRLTVCLDEVELMFDE